MHTILITNGMYDINYIEFFFYHMQYVLHVFFLTRCVILWCQSIWLFCVHMRIIFFIHDGMSVTHTKCFSPVVAANSVLLTIRTAVAFVNSSSQIHFELVHLVISSYYYTTSMPIGGAVLPVFPPFWQRLSWCGTGGSVLVLGSGQISRLKCWELQFERISEPCGCFYASHIHSLWLHPPMTSSWLAADLLNPMWKSITHWLRWECERLNRLAAC